MEYAGATDDYSINSEDDPPLSSRCSHLKRRAGRLAQIEVAVELFGEERKFARCVSSLEPVLTYATEGETVVSKWSRLVHLDLGNCQLPDQIRFKHPWGHVSIVDCVRGIMPVET
ncbi:MAG: hypothetical protein ABGZ35_31375 [Planctomycetaceae bacterium]|jgi:hypothetical protein